MKVLLGNTFRISRTTESENSSRPRAALKMIVPPAVMNLRRFSIS
jgi:hypothetical protein